MKEAVNIEKFDNITVYELDYYDGIKQEVSVEDGILLVWHKYEQDHELWFVIKCDKDILKVYLKNQKPLLDLMKNSEVGLYKRFYENYKDFRFIREIKDYSEFKKPNEQSYLGFISDLSSDVNAETNDDLGTTVISQTANFEFILSNLKGINFPIPGSQIFASELGGISFPIQPQVTVYWSKKINFPIPGSQIFASELGGISFPIQPQVTVSDVNIRNYTGTITSNKYKKQIINSDYLLEMGYDYQKVA